MPYEFGHSDYLYFSEFTVEFLRDIIVAAVNGVGRSKEFVTWEKEVK